jgi:hypothetical protein
LIPDPNAGGIWMQVIRTGLNRIDEKSPPSTIDARNGRSILNQRPATVAFKTTFEVFTRVGPDNSLERLTERSVGLVTDQPSDVYELSVTLL